MFWEIWKTKSDWKVVFLKNEKQKLLINQCFGNLKDKSREICKKKGGFHGIQTLESPKVEGFVKKTGDFRGFRRSRVRKSRDLWKKGGDFTGFRPSRVRKSRDLWKICCLKVLVKTNKPRNGSSLEKNEFSPRIIDGFLIFTKRKAH